MSERVPPAFLDVLSGLTDWLSAADIPAMVIGGIAASILGRPRATRDIDALVIAPESKWVEFLASAATYGFAPRIDDPLKFAARTRVLLLRHVDSAIDIDVIFGRLLFEEQAVARAEVLNVGGVALKLPRVDDLIVMKAIANRPQDLRDIEGLLDVHPDANVAAARKWIREFSTVTTMPDILEEFDRIVARRKCID